MIHIIKCLQDHRQNDLTKYCQDYRAFHGVLFFVQKTKVNARDSDWYFQFRDYKDITD